MAISVTNKLYADVTSNGSGVYTTASVTTVAGNSYVLILIDDGTTVTGGGCTWTVRTGPNFNILYAIGVCSSSTTGVITISGGFPTTTTPFILDEITGATSTPWVQHNDAIAFGGSSSITCTLSTFGSSSNGVYCLCYSGASTATKPISPESGYSVAKSQFDSAALGASLLTSFKTTSDTTPSFTWSGSASWVLMLALEIQAASGGGGSTVQACVIMCG